MCLRARRARTTPTRKNFSADVFHQKLGRRPAQTFGPITKNTVNAPDSGPANILYTHQPASPAFLHHQHLGFPASLASLASPARANPQKIAREQVLAVGGQSGHVCDQVSGVWREGGWGGWFNQSCIIPAGEPQRRPNPCVTPSESRTEVAYFVAQGN